jgi:hypothetical protein
VTQQPEVQVFPLQQGAPAPPQTWHKELLQMVPASVQVLPAQHGPPAAPQGLHMLVLLSQALVASLQPVGLAVVAVQHGWPAAPHSLQE